jgi:hypothetical protein
MMISVKELMKGQMMTAGVSLKTAKRKRRKKQRKTRKVGK